MNTVWNDPPTPQTLLADGDDAAAHGRWRDAVENWERSASVQPELEPDIAARVNWFLVQQTEPRKSMPTVVLKIAGVSLVAALLATVLMQLPDDPGSARSNFLATGAWLLVVVSVVSAIVASRRVGENGTSSTENLHHRLKEARSQAERLVSQNRSEKVSL